MVLKYTKFSTLEVALFLSFISNCFCFGVIYKQQQQMEKLVKKNNDLIVSINTLNEKLSLLSDEIVTIKSRTSQAVPILVSHSGHTPGSEKHLILLGTLALGCCLTYYVGTAIVAKISSFTVNLPVPLFDFSACLAKIPFITQQKVITTFFANINTTIKTTFVGDTINDIAFRSAEMTEFVSIAKAVTVYLASVKETNIVTLNDTTVTSGTETMDLIIKGLESLV